MQCIHPYRVFNKGEYFSVPCGRCVACKVQRAREWSVRMIHELDYYKETSYVTLTFNNENIGDNNLNKKELVNFFKRLRKNVGQVYQTKIKYYACGEYGDDGRKHYHCIIFGLGLNEEDKNLIKKSWSMGFTKHGTVTFQSCAYVAKYCQKLYLGSEEFKKLKYGNKNQPFAIMSQGIGKRFVIQNADQIKNNLEITINGKNVGIPRAYKKILEIDSELLKKMTTDEIQRIYEEYKEKGYFNKKRYEELSIKNKGLFDILENMRRNQREINIIKKIKLKEDKKNSSPCNHGATGQAARASAEEVKEC